MELVNAELIHVRLVITALPLESKGTVRKAICDVRGSFLVDASLDASGPSAGGSSSQA